MKLLQGFLCGVFFLGLSGILCAEEMTLTTYYPAPSGSYMSMRSTKMCIGQICHNDVSTRPNVLDNNLYIQNRLGIGTDNPQATLDVYADGPREANIILSASGNPNNYAVIYLGDDKHNPYKNAWFMAHKKEFGTIYENDLTIGINRDWPTDSQGLLFIEDVTGNVGVGGSPKAKLDVAGEVKIGMSSPALGCSATTAGSVRYNSTANGIEACIKTSTVAPITWGWVSLGGGGAGGAVKYGGFYTLIWDMDSSNKVGISGCLVKNLVTNACSCPAGYTARCSTEHPAIDTTGNSYYDYFSYTCEKL